MKKHTFKRAAALLAASVFTLTLLTGCGSSGGDSADTTITVGASPSPHAEILEVAADELEKEGYTLDIVEYTDYVKPNVDLADGTIDANYFQHQPYLDDYNAQNDTDLVGVAAVHFEPFAIYAGKTTSLDELPDGATVAVPNDTTNEARALQLLAAEGLITLKDGVGLEATKLDIVSNPKNLDIQEIEAAQIPRSLQDVDIACVNGNYALQGELSVDDILATESAESEAAKTYANVIAVRAEDKDSDKTKALIKALQSDAVRDFIESEYNGAVVAVF